MGQMKSADINQRILLGKLGEDIAESLLENTGHKILERNFYIGHSDIDILAKKDSVLIFVEVRTKSSGDRGMPEESLTWKKRQQMKKTAGMYLEKYKVKSNSRLDAVCIIVNSETGEISHLKHYEGV
jgi:putative endonuclease